MAEKVIQLYNYPGSTLYFQIWDSQGRVWNGSAFEAYDALRWSFYDIAMTEQGASPVWTGTFPALDAGLYSVIAYEQAAGAVAETDQSIGGATQAWDGTAFVDVSDIIDHGDATWSTVTAGTISAAVLTTPSNKVAADGSGYVTVTSASASSIGTAVWAVGTRTLTSFGTLVTDITTAVWAAATRSLTTFGSLTTNTATAVWANATRTLSAFSFTVTTDPALSTIKSVTDKLDSALELDGATYRFTLNALERGPTGGDATAANQTTIIADIAALNDVSTAQVTTAVLDAAVDGALTLRTAMKEARSFTCGKIVRTDDDPPTFAFYNNANDTVLFTLTCQTDGSGRVRS